MKAILVLEEMPEKCFDCHLFARYTRDEGDCQPFAKLKEFRGLWGKEKPSYCPLKALPEPLDLNKFPQGADTRMIAIGYNTFRDELLGDTK